MDVHVVPFTISKNQQVASILKLKIKLYPLELYPVWSDITFDLIHHVLQSKFVVELDNAIKRHLIKLSRISGIQESASKKEDTASDGDVDEETSSKAEGNDAESSDEDGADDDQGADAEKRKRQTCDEMEYEDDVIEKDSIEVDDSTDDDAGLQSGIESEIDIAEGDLDRNKCKTVNDSSTDDEDTRSEQTVEKKSSRTEEDSKFDIIQRIIKKSERVVFIEGEELNFEVHFIFQNEPHILLAEVFLQLHTTSYFLSYFQCVDFIVIFMAFYPSVYFIIYIIFFSCRSPRGLLNRYS